MKIFMESMSISRFFLTAFFLTFFWVAPVQAQETNLVYTIEAAGLACPFCAYGIEKQLSKIEGVEKVETNIKEGVVMVTMKEGATLSEEQARKAVEAAGFTLHGFEQESGGP